MASPAFELGATARESAPRHTQEMPTALERPCWKRNSLALFGLRQRVRAHRAFAGYAVGAGEWLGANYGPGLNPGAAIWVAGSSPANAILRPHHPSLMSHVSAQTCSTQRQPAGTVCHPVLHCAT